MKLSKTDMVILNSYYSVIDGLADYLGAGYEFVLHNLESYDNSVVKIINGHYSNRNIGAPITDLALEMMKEIDKKNDSKHRYITYFNRNKKGILTKSSTLPIVGEDNRIIGLLCINFYMDTPLSNILDSFHNSAKEVSNETFMDNIDELINDAIENAKSRVLNDISIPSTNKNKEILAILYDKGIFNLKDSIGKVASCLGISKNTVYLHIRHFDSRS